MIFDAAAALEEENRETLIDLAAGLSGRPAVQASLEDYLEVYQHVALA
ncbi:MAG: hypothetical protein ABSC06_36620 [Rhodopila sp.]